MALAEDNPLSEALRRFEHLAPLGEHDPGHLADGVSLRSAAPGEQLLAIGGEDAFQLFLIEGELELVAADGAVHRVRDVDPAAHGPVSRLRPSRYRVVAVSRTRYLRVEQRLLDTCREPGSEPGVVVEESFPGGEVSALLDESASHPLMFDVLDDLNHDRIVVPSDPEIAASVGAAVGAVGNDSEGLARAVSICPAMTVKVVRAAMAAAPANSPVRSARAAVELLGADDVYTLAANCVLRETLHTPSPLVAGVMHDWWKRTIRISAISTLLARMSERFDPDFAALIGLLHGIAEPVMLGYADRHRDLDDAAALENLLHNNRAELGRMLMTAWNMPGAICDAASHCDNWDYAHGGDPDYTDILLVARWHARVGGRQPRKQPGIDDIPAFRRLGLAAPSPEVSLRIIEAADTAVERSERLLRDGSVYSVGDIAPF